MGRCDECEITSIGAENTAEGIEAEARTCFTCFCAFGDLGCGEADAKFCPTGGIRPNTAADYLALPNVLCVGGTWVCPKDKMACADWSGIEKLARDAAALK